MGEGWILAGISLMGMVANLLTSIATLLFAQLLTGPRTLIETCSPFTALAFDQRAEVRVQDPPDGGRVGVGVDGTGGLLFRILFKTLLVAALTIPVPTLLPVTRSTLYFVWNLMRAAVVEGPKSVVSFPGLPGPCSATLVSGERLRIPCRHLTSSPE